MCLSDFEKFAHETMSKVVYTYFSGGAGEDVGVKENIDAFKRYKIIPRVLCDVSKRMTETTILGHPISFPVCISPTAFHGLAHPSGEIGTANGASLMSIGYTMSSYANRSIEEVAESTGDSLKFFHVQFFNVPGLTLKLVQKAEKLNYKAIVVTVDIPEMGKRISWLRVLMQLAYIPDFTFPNLDGHVPRMSNDHLCDPSTTWENIRWLKTQTRLPIILKGILSDADAVKAVNVGVSGILVSNHGGRQFDAAPAPIDVLTSIVKAVDGRCEVYLDGGVRSGTDVLKALALGARVVFVGRPAIYALCYNGKEGVRSMLQILKDEVSSAMAICGCTSVDDIKNLSVLRDGLFGSHL